MSKQIKPPYRPKTEANTDVSNVDPEFLAEVPEETPLEHSELLKLSEQDGDFDNFTYVNQNNLSELDRRELGSDVVRPMTEAPKHDFKQSFQEHALYIDEVRGTEQA